MENKTNIAELLKNCPKGMELDCSIWDNVVFDHIDTTSNYPIYIKKMGGELEYLTEDGHFNFDCDAKCVIFPKGKTTWEGFQRPFEDGDIVAFDAHHLQIFIFKDKKENNTLSDCYLMLDVEDDELYLEDGMYYVTRFATEEEKKKLFDSLKEQGYKWNADTKTLEKLPKFKDGDVAISDLGDIHLLRTKDSSYCAYRIRWTGLSKLDNTITTGVKVARLATEKEKQILFDSIKANGYYWNKETKSLEKLINKNKFVIGAIVTNGKIKGKICLKDGDSYVLEDGTHVFFDEVHNWELVPNKFDVTTLKPFKSEVLVRDNVDEVWLPCFFGGICNNDNKYPYRIVGGERWNCCIPYEGNEHLLNTPDDCDEYFKTWEE